MGVSLYFSDLTCITTIWFWNVYYQLFILTGDVGKIEMLS